MCVCKVSFTLKTRASSTDGFGRWMLCATWCLLQGGIVSPQRCWERQYWVFPGIGQRRWLAPESASIPWLVHAGYKVRSLGLSSGCMQSEVSVPESPMRSEGASFATQSQFFLRSVLLPSSHIGVASWRSSRNMCHSQTQSLFSNNHCKTFHSGVAIGSKLQNCILPLNHLLVNWPPLLVGNKAQIAFRMLPCFHRSNLHLYWNVTGDGCRWLVIGVGVGWLRGSRALS